MGRYPARAAGAGEEPAGKEPAWMNGYTKRGLSHTMGYYGVSQKKGMDSDSGYNMDEP